MKLNFKDFFNKIVDHKYCVVKLSPIFPLYHPGQDIDIFCRDIERLSREAIGFLQNYVDENYFIRVIKRNNCHQVDLMKKNTIHFRFDFINAIPRFKQVKIKSSLLDVVIESSKEKIIEDFKLKIPNQIDECILRYIEYVEYFAIHPDKIKHVDYINSFFESKPEDKKFFFDRLNHFTCLPIDEISKINKLNKVIKNIKYIKKLILASYYVYKQEGFLSLFEKVSRRLNLKSKKN
jgi:hypothetical protein